MFDGQTLGAEIVTTVRDFVTRSLGPLHVRLEAIEKREPSRGDKGEPGEPGKDGVPGIGGGAGEPGKDGTNGKDGKDADQVDIAKVVADVVAQIPQPKDGAPGKDADPVIVEGLLTALEKLTETARVLTDEVAALRALPVAPASFLIDAAGDLLAVYPDGETKTIGTVRGKDGARGAALMDGAVDKTGQLVLRMSDGRIINAGTVRGEPGKEGAKGANGRDATDIHVLPGIDETKSYAEGVFARYRGGLIRAERQTDPFADGDDLAKAGWGAALDGIAEETERDIDGGRFIERTTVYTSGKQWTRRAQTEAQIWRDIWKDDGEYLRGDTVTRDGSTWHCQVSDTKSVPGTSPDWKLCAKRGNHGKDGKDGLRGPNGVEGKAGRDLTQLGHNGAKF